MSLFEKIVAANDTAEELVDVPEWGVKVAVRGLTGTQRDAYESSLSSTKDGKNVETHLQNFRARMLVKCLFDPEDGKRIFTDTQVGQLGSKSGAVIDRLHDIACRLSGLDDNASARAEGNSDADQSDASITD